MKTSLGLILAIGLIASVSSIAPIKLQPGQSYIYSYSGRLISGIAQFDSSAALLEMKCDIVLQEEQSSHIAMQMMNIRVGKHNGPVVQKLFGHVVVDHRAEPQYEEELSKPIRFYWANGQIKNFEADRNESQWSINIKKSVLSLLNVNLAPRLTSKHALESQQFADQQYRPATTEFDEQRQAVVYPVYEDGINGVCETLYQVISAADNRLSDSSSSSSSSSSSVSPSVQVFNISKTRNYGNCLRQSGMDQSGQNDIRGAPVICHQGQTYPLTQTQSMHSNNYKLGACQDQEQQSQQKDSEVGLYHYVKYNITTSPTSGSSQIDSIFGQGKTVHQIKGKQLVLISEQNVTLMDVVPTSQMGPIQQIRNIMLHQDLSYRLPENTDKLEIPYYQLYGQIDKEEIQEMIPALLDSVVSDIEANQMEPSKNTMQKIVQLANSVSVIDEQHLQNVFDKVAQQGDSHRATSHQKMSRKLFIDLIGHAGTTTAALFAKRLYEQDRIESNEAKEVFETIPQNLYRIDAKVVQAYVDMLLSDKVQNQPNLASSIGIALGKLIRQASLKHETETEKNMNFKNGISRSSPWYEEQDQRTGVVSEEQLQQVLRLLNEALKNCNTFQQKVTLIETLAHAGTSQALTYLAPYVKNQVSEEELPGYAVENQQDIDQERNFIRQVTIYALTHIATHNEGNRAQVLSLLMPIFRNKFEPYEVRIASFTVLLTCHPDKVILEQICSEMHDESNRQVKSFVISALNTVANYSDPSSRKLADDARYALGFAPRDELGMQYSKMIGQSYYDQEKKYGLNVMVEWVASNISQIARSGYLAVRENDGSKQNVLLEVGYNAKGMDSIIKRVAQSNSLINDALQSISSFDKERKVLKRSSEEQKSSQRRETIKSMLKEKLEFNVRNEEEPKATVFLKMFERTSYYSFDRQSIEQLVDWAEDCVKQMTSELVQGQDYHYVRLVMPKQMQKVVYSEMGLPVIVTERHPTIVSLKINQAKLQLSQSSKSSMFESANITLQVEPSIHHTTYNFVFGLLPVTTEAIGTHVEKSSRLLAPFDLSVGYWRSTQKLNWSVTPKVSQEILHHQTEAKTFITQAKIAGSPEREWLAGANILKSNNVPFQYEQEYFKKELGIGMRLQVSTENGYTDQAWYQTRTARKYGLLAAFFELINNHHLTPCTVHLRLESDEQNPVTGYDMSIRYKKVHVNDGQDNSDDTDDDDQSNQDDDDSHSTAYYRYHHKRAGQQTQIFSRSTKSSAEIKKMVRDLVNEWSQDSTSDKWQTDDKADLVAHSVEWVAESQSAQSTLYGMQFLLAHSYDKRMYYSTVQALSQDSTSSQTNKQICLNSIMVYPKAPSDFYYEEIATQNLKALIQSKIDFGTDCQTGSHILVKGTMETGENRGIDSEKWNSESQTEQDNSKEWFYQQCRVDRDNGQPASYACQRALIEDAYFKQLNVDVSYQNIDSRFANLTHKLTTAAKVALYSHVDENQFDVENEADKLIITGQYSTRFANIPMVNVYVRAPKQNVWFEKVPAPYFRPVSALLTSEQVYKNLLKSYQSEEQCIMMEDYVRTFDNVSIPLPDSQCQYLLAKDCSASEIFTIYARQLDTEMKTKEATVLVDGREIVLSPPSSQSTADVQIDGQVFQLQASKARIMSNGQMSVYLRETSSASTSPIVVVEHSQHQLTVLYDGKNIQVRLGSGYKGETCGVCGDDNHESDREFVGPDLCLYEKAEDFINSYALTGSHCQQLPEMKGEKYCSEQSNSQQSKQTQKYYPKQTKQQQLSQLKNQWDLSKKSNSINHIRSQYSEQQSQQHQQRDIPTTATVYRNQQQPQMVINAAAVPARSGHYGGGSSSTAQQQVQRMRTLSIKKYDRICFSVQPILACIEGVSRPYQVQQQVLGFHCLPAQSISAQKLAEQSLYQVLEIFGKKQIDFAATVQVPVSCQTV